MMTENRQIKTKFKSLDDLIELRWYCILILIMAETTAFISMANVTLMVFAGATPTVIECDNITISSCHEYENLKNASRCSNPVLEYQFESVQVETLIISSMGSALFNLIASYSSNLFYFALWRFFAGIFAGGVSVLLEESPRWLVQKGRIEEARRLLIKIRKIDRLYSENFEKDLDEVLRIEAEKEEDAENDKKYTFIHLCCTWKMLGQTATFLVGFICSSMPMYALLFNMEKLSGSIYWNGAIIGATRWIINITVSLADYKLQWFGRKMSVTLSTVITLICLAEIIVFMKTELRGTVLSIGTNLIISMCAQLFLSKYLIVNELYPTAVRNLAMSAVSIMCRVGAMFSPQLFYLSDIAEWIPYAVLIGFQFVDLLIFSLFIPETKGVHLENHLPPKHERIFGKSN
ncbi:hypothetical protein B9Z55_015324 [Caenorhabditis nigoni]|uniref:Major facilitator superfamily (MFS) profile domain-containing protein n=2 Tax=Caenorhabditis nigoni TaxID=1611254 RepID=A0A2G5U9N3_9PELO|nr:hypothetical protein B9Z55_015324 [Caenorhabditis nigoni]